MAQAMQCDRCKSYYPKPSYAYEIRHCYVTYDICEECNKSFLSWFKNPNVKISREENSDKDDMKNTLITEGI